MTALYSGIVPGLQRQMAFSAIRSDESLMIVMMVMMLDKVGLYQGYKGRWMMTFLGLEPMKRLSTS